MLLLGLLQRSQQLGESVIGMIVTAAATAGLPKHYTMYDDESVQRVVIYGYIALVLVSTVAHLVRGLRRIERPAALSLIVLTSASTVWYFGTIIGHIAFDGSSLKGGPLLEAAVLVWILTVLTFSLWYWFIDNGIDFMFPQLESIVSPGGRPDTRTTSRLHSTRRPPSARPIFSPPRLARS
jgi:hypothetical protein